MSAPVAEQHRTNAIILAILGLTVSCIFCPFAIWQARKATTGGVDAKAWEAVGWVDLVTGIIATILFWMYVVSQI